MTATHPTFCRGMVLLGLLNMAAQWGLAQSDSYAQSDTVAQAATAATITLTGNASLVGTNNFAVVGTGLISGLGSAVLSAAGNINNSILSGQTSGPILGTFTLIFPSGDVIVGTFSIPSGILIPQNGQTAAATGSITITGGTGQFTGATGTFASVSGSGVATGLTTSAIQVSGSGTINISGSTSGGGGGTRTLAHAADGNNFKTTIILTNTDTNQATYTLRFNDNNGNVPLLRFELEAGALTGTIPAGKSVTIRTAGIGAQTVQGWAELSAPATVSGTVIYSQPDPPRVQEGTTNIATAGSQHFFMPFDNTNGAVTSAAITNSGANAANNVMVTLRYSSGLSETVPWGSPIAARSHTGFQLNNQFPHSSGQSGVAEFVSDQPLYTVVFRFNSTGAFTALGAVSQ